MNVYTPENWYWQAKDGRIYSSLKQAIVKPKDKDFVAWQDLGNLPTPWPKDNNGVETDAALADVLVPYVMRLYPPTLEEAKARLQGAVDHAAEDQRKRYITAGEGQTMTYMEKVNQAASYSGTYAAYLARPETTPKPNDAEYLLLQASLGIDGNTLLEVAETVTHAYTEWQQIGAAIEATRLKAKAAIDKAATTEVAEAIVHSIVWPNSSSI